MTSKDKTGDQLVASIRKSKSGTVSRKTSTRSTASKSAAGTTVGKTKTGSAKASSSAGGKAKTVSPESGASVSARYSYGRRVWPD